jgi:predicted protein tyrosine phosphatase
MIHVCSLARLNETITATGARHVVTLLGHEDQVPLPSSIARGNYLRLHVHDIVETSPGQIPPDVEHVERLLTFVRSWKRDTPMVIHCWAGISRSSAAAFTTVCALNPRRDEHEIAQAMRAASPTAQPNARIVRFADQLLGRNGRMVDAVQAISPSVPAIQAEPFRIDLA